MAEEAEVADEDEGATEVEETEEAPEQEQDDQEEAPESVLAERDKLRTTLDKIKAERTKLRQELAATKKAPDKEAEPDNGEERVRRLAGTTALVAEGLTKQQAKVAVRLLDLSSLEVDEDGDADLEDAIEELKELFPGLFAKEAPAARRTLSDRVTRADRGGREEAPARANKHENALLRSAGFKVR